MDSDHGLATGRAADREDGSATEGADPMTPEQLAALGDKLRTQDNLATEHPLYVVYDKERIIGLDSEHADKFVWVAYTDDGLLDASEGVLAFIRKYHDDWDDVYYENNLYRRVGYVEINRFRTACLTMDAAKDYIRDNAHHLNKPFVFVESLHRNPQMIAIRRHLMEQGQ